MHQIRELEKMLAFLKQRIDQIHAKDQVEGMI